ncbi:hypothetical protein GS449_14840 [Rhodococcus hoagii]|nr:hypothetical protein [Prescottella equi]
MAAEDGVRVVEGLVGNRSGESTMKAASAAVIGAAFSTSLVDAQVCRQSPHSNSVTA